MKLLFPEQLGNELANSGDSLAKRYVRGFAEGMPIGNVSTSMALIDTGVQQWVVSINDGEERVDNGYVVSPRTTYSGYAREELRRLQRPWLAWPLQPLIQGADHLLRLARVDKMVWINNWLLSTNLYMQQFNAAELEHITGLMCARFADHTFGFRSINDFSSPGLRNALHSLGYVSIPSRQVYLFDGRDGAQASFLSHHNTRLDATLLRRSPYEVVPGQALDSADFQRIEHLYNLLYLHKYCLLNPHYGWQWMQRGQREGWLEFRALRCPEGRIDGALGWFANAEVLSAPVVGYDTALAQRLGLYRQLTQLCLQEAVQRRQLLNFSAGAAGFKRLRGGLPHIEYSLVYIAHLPSKQKQVWRLLSQLLHTIAVPLMRRLEL